MAQNIELKVTCTAGEFASIRTALADRPLRSLETLEQSDVYFPVAAGRLKLRANVAEGAVSAELIQYQRPDDSGARISTYRRVPIAPEMSAVLEQALSDSLGVLARVRKVRTVAVWESTRIHLDEVDGLGQFVELETVLGDSLSAESGRAEFEDAVEWLGLASLESVPGSYSDLMLVKGQDV